VRLRHPFGAGVGGYAEGGGEGVDALGAVGQGGQPGEEGFDSCGKVAVFAGLAAGVYQLLVHLGPILVQDGVGGGLGHSGAAGEDVPEVFGVGAVDGGAHTSNIRKPLKTGKLKFETPSHQMNRHGQSAAPALGPKTPICSVKPAETLPVC